MNPKPRRKDQPATYLSVQGIARKIKRTRTAVVLCAKRIGLQPRAVADGKTPLYSEQDADFIHSKMRRKEGVKA